MGKKRCYFASANTCEGFVSYFDYVLRGAERVYIIKGGPGCGKSTFMRKIGEDMLLKGYSVDFVYCSADEDSLDGIIIHDINTVFVDGTAPHVIDPKYPGAVETILNFGEYWDIDFLRQNRDKIISCTDFISERYGILYSHLRKAKEIHDRWEQEYLKGMDFKKAEDITEKLIKDTITDKNDSEGREWHRFAGALTPQGQVCFYENLVSELNNKYIVKGRPGTGKSTMSKKLAEAALKAGYDVEYYHCAFDPKSIDMIIIPELSFALLDGTAPHVYDPGEQEKLIDMFTCIDENVVDDKGPAIEKIQKEYDEEITKAKLVYIRIKELHDELEKNYVHATDFSELNTLRNKITRRLKEIKIEK